MSLHGLTSITIGVPEVDPVAEFYADFGLTRTSDTTFTSGVGTEQLRLERTPQRALTELQIGASTAEDVRDIADRLRAVGLEHGRDGDSLTVCEPGTGTRVLVTVAPDVQHDVAPRPAVNGPGRDERVDARADAVLREDPVRPRKLGHVVLGSADAESSERFFTSALGFKVSDVIPGVATFLRCSSDHHNVLVLRAPSAFLHHTAWQVDDVDEVGRGATQLIERDPERHVWGPGRHHVGSNFFWYVRDPAGNFCEYYSDVDRIIDDDAWTPGRFEGPKSLYSWGPPPPACFLEPEDVFTPSAVLSSVGRISGK